MHTPWLIASLALLAVSTLLVLIGLRGRRVNDHPLCRRCGFDLFGKPAESTVCSECGADLGRRRAVRVGQRERRRWLLQTAGPMLAISVGWSGLLGWDAARRTDWNRHKPVWWLMWDVDGRPGPTRDAALVELGRRIGDGTLPPARATALVDRALDWQADASKPWSPGWGVVVESARAAYRLPYAKWERYMAQSVTFTLEPFRPGRLFGQPETGDASHRLALRVRRGPDRVGNAKFTVDVQAGPAVTLGGQRTFPSMYTGALPSASLEVPAGNSGVAVGAPLGEMIIDAQSAGGAPAGPTKAAVTLGVRAVRSPEGFVASLIVAVLARDPVPQPVELTAEWTTLPDDPSAPTTLPAGSGPDAAETDAANGPPATATGARSANMFAAGSLNVNHGQSYRQDVELALRLDELTYTPADGTLTGTLECRNPPIALAYDLTLRFDGGHPREAPCGVANFRKSSKGTVTVSTRIPHLNATTADLVLEHSATTNMSQLGSYVGEVWGETVVLKNVPIRRAPE